MTMTVANRQLVGLSLAGGVWVIGERSEVHVGHVDGFRPWYSGLDSEQSPVTSRADKEGEVQLLIRM